MTNLRGTIVNEKIIMSKILRCKIMEIDYNIEHPPEGRDACTFRSWVWVYSN